MPGIPRNPQEWDDWPVGLAQVDGAGQILTINSTALDILSPAQEGLAAFQSLLLRGAPEEAGTPGTGAGSASGTETGTGTGSAAGTAWNSGWIHVGGKSLELAYRQHPSAGKSAVAFYDVTSRRQRERRAAAVARTAARVASERSLPATLNALAHEILQADGLAGVQVLTNEHSGDKLHMLGMAGFPASRSSSFFSLLMECRQLGADLRMLDSLKSAAPVVIPHRYADVMSNPAWKPLHEFHRYPEWDAFASLPITVRENTIGVLNVFLKPGQEIDDEALEFLASMAEQAALAIDYASLLEEERSAAHREERQRLARDLHDSAVQQIFSMSMLTQTLNILAGARTGQQDQRIQTIAAELEGITASVLKDLRGLVTQLRPSAIEGVGLGGALSRLAAGTHRQTGVKFELDLEPDLASVDQELGEDLYYVAAEAVHNAVKHSPADLISIACSVEGGRILLEVRDNGGGAGPKEDALPETGQDGHGLFFMRQRIERWHGNFSVKLKFGGVGTIIRADVPHLVNHHLQGER